jgi:hypothetical protein
MAEKQLENEHLEAMIEELPYVHTRFYTRQSTQYMRQRELPPRRERAHLVTVFEVMSRDIGPRHDPCRPM